MIEIPSVCSNRKDKNGNIVYLFLKLRLHGRFFARDFSKSSTKCGGYMRDNFVDSPKNIQRTEIITIPVDDF